ncbi:tetratricopeptide repeat protein [Candidatus Omnitrophota bacterium]
MRPLVIFLLFALLFISQINTIVDIDLWWNLKTGEHIIKNLEIPYVDIFSYTLEKRTWIDHEWLSQVLFYSVFSRFSWLGLNIIKAFLVTLSFFLILLLTAYNRKKIIIPVFFTLISILAFGYRSALRPEIFSYVLLCIFLYILEREKRLYILPFLQVVWVNLHGYFILGPMLVFFYSIGDFLSGDKARSKKFATLFICVVAACFLNPYFYKGALYPVNILIDIFTVQKLFMQNVHELMMPIRSSFSRYVFFWFFAIFSSITFIINLRNVKIKHILIFALSFFAAYMAVRNIPIFIFLGLGFSLINLNKAPLTRDMPERKYYAVSILIICGMIYFFLSNRYYQFTNQFGLRKTESRFSNIFMPSGACDFLDNNKIEGPMFNTLDFGPYIGYRFYPAKRVFIDTRTDLYRDDFYELYRKAQNYPSHWRALHKKYGFEIVLLRHLFGGTERISRYLYEDKDWRLVYYDENSCVFLNGTPKNRLTIDRFEIDFNKVRLKDSDVSINIARFFEKIGERLLAEEIYIGLLDKDPRFLEAGNNLAAIYINSGRYDEALSLAQKFLNFYPKSAELYANIGTAYMRLGKKQNALMMLEKSAKLNPYLRKASYMLGIVQLERGNVDKAMNQFIKYSRLDPYNVGVHRILGDIYTQKGLLKKAELEYNEADALEGADL